jgi:hypothetical protein
MDQGDPRFTPGFLTVRILAAGSYRVSTKLSASCKEVRKKQIISQVENLLKLSSFKGTLFDINSTRYRYTNLRNKVFF